MTIYYTLTETHEDGTETSRLVPATVVETREHLEALLALATVSSDEGPLEDFDDDEGYLGQTETTD